MNQNQRCLITILTDHDRPLTTSEILDATQKHPELCQGCSSGSEVISAGMALMAAGKVTRQVAKGGFVWSLTTKMEKDEN